MGAAAYPHASLVITADGGGTYRLRLWKLELQGLVDELGFPVTASLTGGTPPSFITRTGAANP